MSTFTCERCGRIFEKGVTDEEALKEMRELFGDLPESERATVCDDCHQELLAWLNPPGATAN